MTPGKGIAVRFGVNKGNKDALMSPMLPPVASPSGGAGAGPAKSSFYKKAQGGGTGGHSSTMAATDEFE